MKAACVGQMVADVIAKGVKRIPEKGVADFIDSVTLKTGGCALTCAVVMDRLKADVAIFGLLGEDPQGKFILDAIRGSGIDLRGVRISSRVSTTTSVIVTDAQGERSFLYAPGSVEAFSLADIDMELLEACDIWHFPGVSKLTSLDLRGLLERGKKLGKILTMDTDYDATGKWYENIAPYLEYLNYFLPSYDEAHRIAALRDPGAIAKFFLGKGVEHVVIKLGAEGCFGMDARGSFGIPGFAVPCVDTTGAGDSFVAGFLYGITHQWDLKRCCLFANACGALSVMEIGAGGHIRDYEGVEAFLEEQSLG